MSRLFLLSPASCTGARAKTVMRAEASFPLAVQLRTHGAALGDVFAFLSGLYFRGKITYARAFGRALIITTNRGLLPPQTLVHIEDLQAMAGGDISSANPAYRMPLLADLMAHCGPSVGEVVLLGSVATGKYVDVMTEVLGPRLMFPVDFVGRGDMSRGGLLLRCAQDGQELTYAPVQGTTLHGARPPKLVPRPRVEGAALPPDV